MSAPSVPIAYAVVDQPPVVQVVAPADLAEGYTFHATFNGTVFPVVVPPGGVEKGQRFTVPFVADGISTEATPLFGNASSATSNGYFKDGLLECCALGPFHVSLWNALICPQILMAQVLTRMKLDWCGNESSSWHLTFRRVFILVIVYWVVSTFLAPPKEVEDDLTHTKVKPHVSFWRWLTYNLVTSGFGVYTLVVLMKLRHYVRERYRIRNTTFLPGIVEDFCCAFWCGCCTVAQLARQTADYEQQRALCCSDTGLPPSADIPVVIV